MSMQIYGTMAQQLFPLTVGDENCMIDKKAFIHNHEVFKAILNGYYIDLSGNKDEKGD